VHVGSEHLRRGARILRFVILSFCALTSCKRFSSRSVSASSWDKVSLVMSKFSLEFVLLFLVAVVVLAVSVWMMGLAQAAALALCMRFWSWMAVVWVIVCFFMVAMMCSFLFLLHKCTISSRRWSV